MHKFTEKDLVTCLEDRRFVLIGDSTMRQVFWAIAKKLDFQQQEGDRHANVSFRHKGISIEFIWDPFLNSTSFQQELIGASVSTKGLSVPYSTAILFIGGGLWHARYLGQEYLRHYEDFLNNISQNLFIQDEKALVTRSIWSSDSALHAESPLILSPVLIPAYQSLSTIRAQSITPKRIEAINERLQHAAIKTNLPLIWSYILMTTEQKQAHLSDGLHVTENVASSMADLLLSLRCNSILRRAQAKVYPVDKTCCTNYQRPNGKQSMILNVTLWFLPILTLITLKNFKRCSFLPSHKKVRAIAVLALAMCYCYCADRTTLFTKTQKQYVPAQLITSCAVALLLGILSISRSETTTGNKLSAKTTQVIDQPFLSRHQTDEWKGWMQMVILLYHYTGASKILWIYEIVRVLVASYLFMTGFGHTMFFCKRADYSLRRGAAVLIRLNMLSCTLPFMMQTDYLFYYFAPLISFWYLVIYFTMAIGQSRNHSASFLVVKLVISAAVVTLAIRVPGFFELVFYVLGMACNIHWDVNEWRFRLRLDSLIVYAGMLCAVINIKITGARFADEVGCSGLNRRVKRYTRYGRLALVVTALMGLSLFFMLALRAPTKQVYNGWIPFFSWIPIFSFIVLRNYSHRLRNSHSAIFAWIGRYSLETFVLQYHIWLAADTKGLLGIGVLGRAIGADVIGRRIETAVLTTIFVWVCWHVGIATQTLTTWLVDPQEQGDFVGISKGFAGDENGLLGENSKGRMMNDLPVVSVVKSFFEKRASISVTVVKRLVAKDLRVRLAIIVAFIWLLNVV